MCGHEDAPVVVYEEGQGTAKVGSGVAVLIAEGPRLSVKGQVFVPADCGQACLQGKHGLFRKIRPEGELRDGFRIHEISADDVDGQGNLSAVAHFHEHEHETRNEGLRVGGENGVAAAVVVAGHEREEQLGELVGAAHGEGILGVGLVLRRARQAAFSGRPARAADHVREEEKIIVAAHYAAHGVELDGELRRGLGVDVEQSAAHGQIIEGQGHERLRLAGSRCSQNEHVREDVVA